jgi:GTP-binding protein Era
VDAAAGVGRGDAFVYNKRVEPAPLLARFCAVNKIDRLSHSALVPQLAAVAQLGEFEEIVPVSAADGTGVDELRSLILERLPEGPKLFPEDEVTDQTLDVRVGELVREQALKVTRQEVPHSVAVLVDEIEREDDLTRVTAEIVVERDSQKGILIGKGGETLKAIGTAAREQIELLLGTKVFLDLRVRVMKEWQRDPRSLDRLGF